MRVAADQILTGVAESGHGAQVGLIIRIEELDQRQVVALIMRDSNHRQRKLTARDHTPRSAVRHASPIDNELTITDMHRRARAGQ